VYFSLSFGFVCQYISQVIGWEDLLLWYLWCRRVSPTKTRLKSYLLFMLWRWR